MNLIVFNNNLYRVKRTILESKLRPDFDQELFRQWLGCDIILRKEGIMYACELISEPEILSISEENFF
jgi:hypothetical protein